MKYILSLITLAAFCVAIGTSCSKDKNYYEVDDNDRTAIRLSSSVELGALRLQELQIEQGQSLSFFVTEASDLETLLYENEEIMANGTGGFTYEETMYYPTNGNDVDFYAVHPYSANATLDENITFSIAENQSVQLNYLNSDLLHATRKDVPRSVSAVSMIFSHKLSLLNFEIIQGDGADISGLNAVTTLSVAPSVLINPVTGTLGSASGTPVEVISYGVVAPDPEATTVSGISAIVVPQTFPAGQRLFRIRLGNIDYYYTPTQGQTFEPGYKYTLKLTINQAGIELESSIADWTDGGTINGEGSID